MAFEFFWQLPTNGDGRYADAEKRRRGEREYAHSAYLTPGVSDPRGDAYNYFDYLHQVARAAELGGFNGIQIRNDPDGDESWIVAGYLARSTKYLTIIAEFDASRGSAVYAAKNAVSYQRFSHGRFAWQIGTGGNEKQRRSAGDFIAEQDILKRIDEFVTVAQNVITQTSYTFQGEFFQVLEGGFKGPLSNQKVPPVYLAGFSDEAYQLSAKLADVHVLDAKPVEQLKPEIAKLSALAAAQGRKLDIALRIDLLARETEEEAQFDAERFGQQSGNTYEVGSTSLLRAGLSGKHTDAAATLVGSYEQVIEKLVEYAHAGVTTFILGAVPSLEEAYRVGEIILPEVRSLISGAGRRVA